MKKKTICYLLYIIIFFVSIFGFSLGLSRNPFGFGIIFIWIINPIALFIGNLLVGMEKKTKWISYLYPVITGILFMLLPYLTYSLANTIATGNINPLDFSLLLIGTLISLAGYLIGVFVYHMLT